MPLIDTTQDVRRYANYASLPATAENGQIVVALTESRVYQRISGIWRIIGGSTPKFHTYRSASVAIGNAAETTINFDIESFDSDNLVASGVFTCNAQCAGMWLFTYGIVLGNSATGTRNAWVTSSRYAWTTSLANTAAASPALSTSVILSISASQIIDVRVFHDAGANLNVNNNSYFQGQYLSP